MKLRPYAIAFVLLVPVVVGFGYVANHSGTRRPEVVARSVDVALDGLPREVGFVAGVDLPRLAASPLGAHIVALASAPVIESCRLPGDRAGLLVFGGDMEGTAGVGLLAGKVSEQAVVSCLQGVLASRGAAVVNEPVAGRTAYHPDGRAPDIGAWLAFTADGKLAAASDRVWLERLLTASSPRARQNEAFAREAALVDDKAAVWAVGVLTPAQRQWLERFAEGKLERAPDVVRVAAYVAEKVDVKVAWVFESSVQAIQAVGLAKAGLIAYQHAGTAQPWASILDDADVTVQGREAVLELALDAKDVDVLAAEIARRLQPLAP